MTLVAEAVGPAVALGVSYGLIGVAVAIVAAATRSLFLAVGAIASAGLVVALVLGAVGGSGPARIGGALVAVLLAAAIGGALGPAVLARREPGVVWTVGFVVAAGVLEAAVQRMLGARAMRVDPLVPGADPVVTAVVVGLPAALLLAWVLRSTRWGHRVRIAGSSRDAAERTGIRVLGVQSAALAVAGAAAVLAAVLVAPVIPIGAAQAAGLTVRGIAAAALLGRAGAAWALPGGLALGIVEVVGQRAWPAAGGDVALAAVVVVVLAARGASERQAWGRPW